MFQNPIASLMRWSFVTSLLFLSAATMRATQPFGFTSQTFRGKITSNVNAHQWNDSPLFTLLIQSSSANWGLDVIQGTTEFAAADPVSGRPSQSGWHDHPTVLSIAVVVQGTVWSHAAGSNCLQALPAGTVFTERSGEIHNNYNLDPRTPAIVRITHFVDRNQSATRRDQPDPVTGKHQCGSTSALRNLHLRQPKHAALRISEAVHDDGLIREQEGRTPGKLQHGRQ